MLSNVFGDLLWQSGQDYRHTSPRYQLRGRTPITVESLARIPAWLIRFGFVQRQVKPVLPFQAIQLSPLNAASFPLPSAGPSILLFLGLLRLLPA
ncbi:hypothetical protein BO85DRAFT_13159 [Aspergillus piperis CBS 112811]|uniref:Uncharacterized protein n=1 Tax=Aspergillus piperis CBS 112811 TaxID=1448313 RepID=A0A8G1RDZ3_9EURO|nr:hypothetical protein BO85DRAFT_13159 [Aspergillus piperis CBS 112811]RAH62924.1 hypothetical protein BO85DRAFT_13159 [Aspergillus piperis CBS 112811]